MGLKSEHGRTPISRPIYEMKVDKNGNKMHTMIRQIWHTYMSGRHIKRGPHCFTSCNLMGRNIDQIYTNLAKTILNMKSQLFK